MTKHIKVLGIDLAKNIFQLHGADNQGKRILKKRGSTPVAVGIEVMPSNGYNACLLNQSTHLYGQY